eukprot:1588524-Amphidinium_carterae.1
MRPLTRLLPTCRRPWTPPLPMKRGRAVQELRPQRPCNSGPPLRATACAVGLRPPLQPGRLKGGPAPRPANLLELRSCAHTACSV